MSCDVGEAMESLENELCFGFDSQLYPRNFSGSIGSGTGSTQPRDMLDMRSSKIRLRKLKLRLRDKRFA